ncbi:MAG TPA: GNAT family N-acetyltransferase [Pyrinomonadaceae bacterium]|nr:GNAT family N-acetyltransferase [Pyrinomonadaceae bacterium]
MFKIELLTKHHEVVSFDCGDDKKNGYLRRFALQNTKGGIGKSFVAVSEDNPLKVCGYYTISSSSVSFDETVVKNLPRYPLPTILIGKLATDLSIQRKGLGTILLFDALQRSLKVAEEIGVLFVELRAVDDRARNFYERWGFKQMDSDEFKLFIGLKSVRRVLAETDNSGMR